MGTVFTCIAIFLEVNMKKKNNLFLRIYKARLAYLFLLPIFSGLIIFSYYPAFSGLFYSMFQWDGVKEPIFTGVDNFKRLFSDAVFIDSIWVMLKLFIPRLLIGIFVPLIVAELIFSIASLKAKYWYRVLVLLPMVAPGVVSILIWKYIYDPNYGLLVGIMKAIGIVGPNQAIDWLGNPSYVLFSIIFMGFPWIGGTSVLIYLSGLMNISSEIIESSVLDGAGRFKRILYIDIPEIIGQIRYFLIFGLIGTLQDFSIQVILTKGGPGNSTMVPGYYMFTQAFEFGNLGYACAIGTFLFTIIMMVTILSFKFVRVKE